MQPIRYFYLVKIQYLGFRYHGWQKQPTVKTVEHMIDRTLRYILGKNRRIKILASGRTDAKVSVNQSYFELFLEDEPLDLPTFFPLFNRNLPQDIRVLSIQETTEGFNIIQHPQIKEYHYNFCFGQKFHPFCAPFMTNITEELQIEKMKKAAKLFEGKHDFWSYTFQPKPQTQTRGEVLLCQINENETLKGSFFPEQSYTLKIKGKGFKRHQIRLIMGTLFQLGLGEIDLSFIHQTLQAENRIHLTQIASASGLILHSVDFLDVESPKKVHES